MKHISFYTSLIIFLFVLFPSSIQAKVIDREPGEAYILPESETINDDLFLSSDQITINGTVNGDIYAIGRLITITGTVNGDILVAGGTLLIDGATIKDDIRIAGGNVDISKTQVGDNVTVIGGNISITESTIAGTVATLGGVVSLDSSIGRNLYGGVGTMVLLGSVGQEVSLGADSLMVGENTELEGGLNYYSTRDATISETASIGGDITKNNPHGVDRSASKLSQFDSGMSVYLFLAMLLIGSIFLHLFPHQMRLISENITVSPKATIGWGLVIFLATGPALLLLIITGIGIPLAFILGMMFMIELLVAPVVIGVILGQFLTKNIGLFQTSALMQLAIGIAAYYLLTAVPILNIFVWIIARLITLGGIFVYKKSLINANDTHSKLEPLKTLID
jgi:hypothetical protein